MAENWAYNSIQQSILQRLYDRKLQLKSHTWLENTHIMTLEL